MKLMLKLNNILVVRFEKKNHMYRFSIKDILNYQNIAKPVVYKNQLAIINIRKLGPTRIGELFSMDAFTIGYILEGSSTIEFNNTAFRIGKGDFFLISPTHTCSIKECSNDFLVRLLLIESNSDNMGVHLNYLIKTERWTTLYFNPVIHLNEQENRVMKLAVNRIIEQIERTCPDQAVFIRLSLEWHYVELDNIMLNHAKEWSNTDKPLTHKQELAHKIYVLATNNFKKEHHIGFYSDRLCLTPQYINQIMNSVMGRSLSNILSDLLFSAARSMLLSSEMSIQEIADELNFPDQASFSKFIKKASGMSPKILRHTQMHSILI